MLRRLRSCGVRLLSKQRDFVAVDHEDGGRCILSSESRSVWPLCVLTGRLKST